MEEREGYFDGWKITEKQLHLINRRDLSPESKAAFEQFFNENYRRLYFIAKKVLFRGFRSRARGYDKIFTTYKQRTIRYDDYNRLAKDVLCKRIIVTPENVIEVSDLLNSLYADYLDGYIIFKYIPSYISGVICHAYRYAPVGGLRDVAEYRPRSKEKC